MSVSIHRLAKCDEKEVEDHEDWYGKCSGAAKPNYDINGTEFGGYASAFEEWAETC